LVSLAFAPKRSIPEFLEMIQLLPDHAEERETKPRVRQANRDYHESQTYRDRRLPISMHFTAHRTFCSGAARQHHPLFDQTKTSNLSPHARAHLLAA
jgi:hypothetical protein